MVFRYNEQLERVWEQRFQPTYGRFRSEVRQAFYKYMDCGVVVQGCARAKCDRCNHSQVIAFSCKVRGACPSCDTKRKLLFAEHLHDHVLRPDAPHQHVVFSIPKRLRVYVHKGAVELSKIEILDAGSTMMVRYHKDELNYKDYEPLEFLALLSTHIPGRWEQTTRYMGEYSSRTRGKRRQQGQSTHNTSTLTLGELSDKPAPSSTWARLIKQVFEVDPLVCTQCGGPMKIVAFITDRAEVQRLCRNLRIAEHVPSYYEGYRARPR